MMNHWQGYTTVRLCFWARTSSHSFLVLPRHGRIPLGCIPWARQLDFTIRRGRENDIVGVRRRVCVPPRGRVEVEKEKREEVQQKGQTLRRSEHTVGWTMEGRPTHLYIPRTYVTWSISTSWTTSSSSSVADMNDNLLKDVNNPRNENIGRAYPDATSNWSPPYQTVVRKGRDQKRKRWTAHARMGANDGTHAPPLLSTSTRHEY